MKIAGRRHGEDRNLFGDLSEEACIKRISSWPNSKWTSKWACNQSACIKWRGIQWACIEWRGIKWACIEWASIEWASIQWTSIEWAGIKWATYSKWIQGRTRGTSATTSIFAGAPSKAQATPAVIHYFVEIQYKYPDHQYK